MHYTINNKEMSIAWYENIITVGNKENKLCSTKVWKDTCK